MSDAFKTPTLARLREQRDTIIALAERYGASNVRVFGSVARNEATPESDVDLLVEFASDYKLRDLIRLTQALQNLIQHRVEVVDQTNIREELRRHIMRDATPL
ncbi:MAG: nucleotidyltransferase family protein [Chloroflexota bacterium]|nr:nucleotidyltransferase family protein [Chloroflexota bacterium]